MSRSFPSARKNVEHFGTYGFVEITYAQNAMEKVGSETQWVASGELSKWVKNSLFWGFLGG